MVHFISIIFCVPRMPPTCDRNVFREMLETFWRFLYILGMFLELLGPKGMRLDMFGFVPMRLDTFGNIQNFLTFCGFLY